MTVAAPLPPLDRCDPAQLNALCVLGKAVCDLILAQNNLARVVPDHPAIKVIDGHREALSSVWRTLLEDQV